MKIKKIYLTLSLLIGLLSISFCSSATALFNAPIGTSENRRTCGAYASTVLRTTDIVNVYRDHYHTPNDPYKHFYSTHDYIAHYAIDYLVKCYPTNKYFWLTDTSRRYFYTYLLATEYPDYQYVAPKITLDCGKSTQVNRDFNGESHALGNCMGMIQRREIKVYQNLYKMDDDNNLEPLFETAAFYLGAMTHYITEMAHPHHASKVGSLSYHSWLEKGISKLTTLEAFQSLGFFTINLQTILS
ncbi:MAG: hypothetical protein ACFFE4_16530 [Candidatus Thorarchaeota archaeon]